jgi:uncharacterized NAD(P)/FAD-binding protein YdhS
MSKMKPQVSDCAAAVAIVGGGASGTLLATRLLLNAHRRLRVRIVEPREKLGQGVAYSSRSSVHLLNVPAGNMSALPEEPEHFLNWLRQGHNLSAAPYSFESRRVYAAYLLQLLREAQEKAADHVMLEHVHDRVMGLVAKEGSFELILERSRPFNASAVVLALGNEPAPNPLPAGSDVEVVNPWAAGALTGLPRDGDLLLIGSGLTAVDVCLSLAEVGHSGRVYLLSRHGLLPGVHPDSLLRPGPLTFETKLPGKIGALCRAIRKAVARERGDGGWQRVIDALRPHTNHLWQSLTADEKRRFMRHLRTYWEVARHRMPVEVSRQIEAMRLSGQLRVLRGRLIEASKTADGDISVRVRGGTSSHDTRLRAARIVNCTGPQNDPRRSTNPLVRQLLRDRMTRLDPLFLGFETTPEGALIRGDGRPWANLFGLGPARKGTLWETTAIPEIRRQASELARSLLSTTAHFDYQGARFAE